MANKAFRIEVEGLTELQKKVRGDALLHDPYNRMMGQVGSAGSGRVRSLAPRASGRLASAISEKLGPGAVAKNVKVIVGVKHATHVDYGPKTGRKGRMVDNRPRNPNLGRMRKAVDGMSIDRQLDEFMRAVEQRWGR